MRVAPPLRQRRAPSPPNSSSSSTKGGGSAEVEETRPLMMDDTDGTKSSMVGLKIEPEGKMGTERASKPQDGGTHTSEELSLRRILPSLCVILSLSFACHALGLSDLAEDVTVAAARTLVQLSCLGAVLSPLIKSTASYPAPLYVLLFMLPLAAYESSARSSLTYDGARWNALMGLGTAVIANVAVAVFGVLRPTPRLGARHVIPLAGMLLNNSLSAVALALDRLLDELKGGGGSGGSSRLELMLAFGATPSEASYPAAADAVTSSMVPTLNAMNVIGLVAIPGMMTGQILGGSNPTRAARYQIMIMFLIAAACGMSAGITCWLTVRDAFDDRGVFLDERIVEQRSARISKLLGGGPGGVGLTSLFGGSSISNEAASSAAEEGSAIAAATVVLRSEEEASPSPVGLTARDDAIEEEPLFSMDLHGTIRAGAQPFRAALALPPNSVTAVLGPSGMGKSTLLKLVAELSGGGALDSYNSAPPPKQRKKGHSPSSSFQVSSIKLHGRERHAFPPHEWRRRVTYLPQNAASSAGLTGTPRELLEDVLNLRVRAASDANGGGGRDAAEVAEGYLSEWGLPSILLPSSSSSSSTANNGGTDAGATVSSSPLDRPWSDLSGGEGQRILLALALASRPDVLLLDEPTSGLDENAKRTVEGTLARLASLSNGGDSEGWNCAIVMVTHDEEQAQRVAGMGSGGKTTRRGRYRLVEES